MTRREWLDGTLTDMVRRIAEERRPQAEEESVVAAVPGAMRTRRRRAPRMFPDAPGRTTRRR